jgi:AraC-like DNA-binding protein
VIEYKKHRLSRVIAVQEIESADYVRGIRPATCSHAHGEAWEICVCLDGETIVDFEHEAVTLPAGQLLLIQPGKRHGVSVYREDSAAFVVSFTCTNGANLFPLVGSPLEVGENQTDLFRWMIRELNSAFRRTDQALHLFQFDLAEDSPFGAEHAICCYLELVLLSLLRNVTMEAGEVVPSSGFAKAINAYLADQVSQYIEDHIGERLTVESVAKQFHYSRARLGAIYKAVTGVGINEAINEKKIARAKVLLMEGELSVTGIAEELGFSSSTYFTHKFTKSVGVSPTQYVARFLSGE